MTTAAAEQSTNGNGDPATVPKPAAPAPTLAESVKAIHKASAEAKDVVVESDEFIDALILAMLSRTHVYVAGAGGVGKTFGSEVVAEHFGVETFYIQFRNDTKREEVFGPLSMRALQNDEYEHVTAGYLPEAELALLDEFKDAGRFTRQLLNILNERRFKNGRRVTQTPLRAAVGTSNFWIEEQELEALFDRFAQRLMQEAVRTSRGFRKVLKGQLARDRGAQRSPTIVTRAMLEVATNAVVTCNVEDHIVNALDELRKNAAKENLHMSPRRWGEGLKLARAVAVLAGRDTVTEDDLRVFVRVLPNHPDDFTTARDLTKHLRDKLTAVVEEAEKGVEEVRGLLAPARELVSNGQARSIDFKQLTEARQRAEVIEERLEAARKEHHGGQPHKGLDAIVAALDAEKEFVADIVLGRVK